MGKRRPIIICDERGRHLISLYAPQQGDPESIAPQQTTEKGGDPRENVPPATVAVPPRAQSPQPPTHSRKTYRGRQECRDRWKLGVEVFTAVVILAYTTVAALQWLQMRWSLEQAKRAWMVFNTLSAPGETAEQRRIISVANGRASLMATFVNVGESPAFNVVVKTTYLILNKDQPLSCEIEKLPGEPESRAVVPNDSRENPLRTEIVIENVTEDMIRAITETKTKRLVIGGAVEYDDAFSHPRETSFCVFYAPGNPVVSFQYCPCLNRVG